MNKLLSFFSCPACDGEKTCKCGDCVGNWLDAHALFVCLAATSLLPISVIGVLFLDR